jgi:hypothetical protein
MLKNDKKIMKMKVYLSQTSEKMKCQLNSKWEKVVYQANKMIIEPVEKCKSLLLDLNQKRNNSSEEENKNSFYL